uniref:Pk1 n=1 Tax=Trichoplusia ni single nucleopolyhedrovirus TaxID=332054 RepID=A0A481V7P9_9ABAC|nr:pk1 [Trichoplusia ni single nucleopolyhedrovirus]
MDGVVEEMSDFLNELVPETKIKVAEGKFGKVSVWRHKDTQKLFLQKEITPENFNGIEVMVHDLMKNNKFFIKLYYFSTTLKTHLLIMDYIKGGDLWDLLRQERKLDEMETKLIIMQLVEALYYLHSHQIIHNDIKLENIIYSRYRQIYLCDYGLCKSVKTDSCYDGTMDYFSPEKIKGHQYNFSFDWWAVGVLTYELITGNHPFKNYYDEDLTVKMLHYRQQHKKLRFNSKLSKKLVIFMDGMLKYNYNYRLNNVNDIMKQEFINIDIYLLK